MTLGVFWASFLLFSYTKGPRALLKKSYSKCLRRTQIRWAILRSSSGCFFFGSVRYPLCDTISKWDCAIWGGISHWAGMPEKFEKRKAGFNSCPQGETLAICWPVPTSRVHGFHPCLQDWEVPSARHSFCIAWSDNLLRWGPHCSNRIQDFSIQKQVSAGSIHHVMWSFLAKICPQNCKKLSCRMTSLNL